MRRRMYGVLAVLICWDGLAVAGNIDWKSALESAARLQSDGKLEDAERVLIGGLADASQAAPGATPLLLSHLARVYHDEMRYLDAQKTYWRAIAAYENAGGAKTMGLARTLNNLASLLWETDQPKTAEELLVRSRSLQIEMVGHADAETLLNLGLLRKRQQRWAAAQEPYSEMLLLRDREGRDLPQSAIAAVHLAAIYGKMRQSGKVLPLLQQADRVWIEQRDTADPKILADLAIGHLEARRYEDARRILKHALDARLHDSSSTTAYALLRLYATALRKSNLKAEARDAETRADAIGFASGQLLLARQTVAVSDVGPQKKQSRADYLKR